MGVMGLHDLLIYCEAEYGSERGNEIVDKVFEVMATTAYRASINLAKEKGSFPFLKDRDSRQRFVNSGYMLKMPEDIVKGLRDRGLKVTETSSLKDAVQDADVLYVTRVQRERFPNKDDYEKVKDLFIVDEELVSVAKEGMIILHPLPRVNEITVGVDQYPGALYFVQAHNGLYVRMALLALTTGSVR
jgi:aspartate carbamoyltransferase catalytic subunit